MTKTAVDSTKSIESTGPVGIAYRPWKRLGPVAIAYRGPPLTSSHKAFDTVPCTLLFQKIFNTKIGTHAKKWLANYLPVRQAYNLYNDEPSTTKRLTNRVPQGSVLFPTSLNIYTHDIPTNTP